MFSNLLSRHKFHLKPVRFSVLVAALLMVACSTASSAIGPTLPPNTDPAAANTPIVQIIPPTLTPEPLTFWIQSGVPQTIVNNVTGVLTQAGYVQSDAPDGAILQVVLDPGPDAALTAQWVYAVAAPFATVPDSISLAELQAYWQGSAGTISTFESAPNLVISTDVADLLIARFGSMAANLPVTMLDSNGLADAAWNTRLAISILPFEQLEPRWKVLSLDGQSVLDKALDVNAYPLTVRVGVIPQGDAGLQAVNELQVNGAWQATNRDPNQLSIVVMTGVTAMVRSTAMQMELRGYNFPAEKILPFFADADILHTSNEVSFAVDCPEPQWTGDPKGFCSQLYARCVRWESTALLRRRAQPDRRRASPHSDRAQWHALRLYRLQFCRAVRCMGDRHQSRCGSLRRLGGNHTADCRVEGQQRSRRGDRHVTIP
jgi:hypothetical protein